MYLGVHMKHIWRSLGLIVLVRTPGCIFTRFNRIGVNMSILMIVSAQHNGFDGGDWEWNQVRNFRHDKSRDMEEECLWASFLHQGGKVFVATHSRVASLSPRAKTQAVLFSVEVWKVEWRGKFTGSGVSVYPHNSVPCNTDASVLIR